MNIYDYKSNITVTTTIHGDKVITMNSAIFDRMLNDISDAHIHQHDKHLDATARDTQELWRALIDKEEGK